MTALDAEILDLQVRLLFAVVKHKRKTALLLQARLQELTTRKLKLELEAA